MKWWERDKRDDGWDITTAQGGSRSEERVSNGHDYERRRSNDTDKNEGRSK